jgi:hypothetical protein
VTPWAQSPGGPVPLGQFYWPCLGSFVGRRAQKLLITKKTVTHLFLSFSRVEEALADQEDNEFSKLQFAAPAEIEYPAKDRWFLCRFVLPPVARVIGRRIRHSSGPSGVGDLRRGA